MCAPLSGYCVCGRGRGGGDRRCGRYDRSAERFSGCGGKVPENEIRSGISDCE